MNISKFTLTGYARFYRSLLRFSHDINNAHALKLTYGFYTAVNSSYRHKNPGVQLTDLADIDFYEIIRQTKVKTYRTEIQFYRAMEAVLYSLALEAIQSAHVLCVLELIAMMSDTELRFYKAFDMEIDDERTIYSLCAKSLMPRRDEPGLCLIQDWNDAITEV